MKTPGIYYGAIAAFCVISILVGFAGAADTAVPVKNGAGIHGFGHGQPPSMEAMIDHLEQQGVDVTEVITALRNGDDEAVKAWLDAYREAHKGEMQAREDRPGPEKFIERLEQQGVDVTEVKTALQNGDNEAVKTWLEAYREENRDQMRPASRMGNVTQGCGQNR